jgi:hypothetical protein
LKPPTPEQARIKAMQAQVKRAQAAVKQERIRQQQVKLNQARAAVSTSVCRRVSCEFGSNGWGLWQKYSACEYRHAVTETLCPKTFFKLPQRKNPLCCHSGLI